MSEGHHIRLRELGGPGKKDTLEVVPAESLGENRWRVGGTPGLVAGCAAGDEIVLAADGTFRVGRRGGNVAIQVLSKDPIDRGALERLRAAFAEIGGLVEWPANNRFAAVTIPVSAGFGAIETVIVGWMGSQDDAHTAWYYGNVYGADGAPLGWWAD